MIFPARPLAFASVRSTLRFIRPALISSSLAFCSLSCFVLTQASAAVFTVDTLQDQPDLDPDDGVCLCADGGCSLRAAIQAANANTGPDTIRIEVSGTLAPTHALPSLIDVGSSILGPGAESFLIDGSGAGPGVQGIHVVSDHNVLEGFAVTRFDGDNVRLDGASYNIVRNCVVSESANGIGLNVNDGGHDNRIENCHFSGNRWLGVRFTHGSNHNVVADCTSMNNFEGGMTSLGSHYNTFRNNLVSGNPVAGFHVLAGATNNLYEGNRSTGNLIGMIFCTPDTQSNLIRENTLTENTYGVILLEAGANTFEENAISASLLYGVALSDSPGSVFRGNRIERNLADGVNLFWDTPSPGITFLENSVLANNGHGINLARGGEGAVIENNRILSNLAAGIFAESGNLLIRGNVIEANGWDGIHLISGAGSSITDNTVQDNGLDGGGGAAASPPDGGVVPCGDTNSAEDGAGLLLEDASAIRVLHNTFYGNGAGVRLTGCSTGITVKDNIIWAKGSGLDVSPLSSVENAHNLIWSEAGPEQWYANAASPAASEMYCNPSFSLSAPDDLSLRSHSCAIAMASDGTDLGAHAFAGIKVMDLVVGEEAGGFPSIQSAVDAAWCGYRISVSAGLYEEDVALVAKPSITVVGAGQAVTIVEGSDAALTFSGDSIGNRVEGFSFRGSATGIAFREGADENVVRDSRVDPASGASVDIESLALGTNALDNVAFDADSVEISSGEVNVSFQVRSQVLNPAGVALPWALCTLRDAHGGTHSLGTTNLDGTTPWVLVPAFTLNPSGYPANNNPYELSVTRSGYVPGAATVSVHLQDQVMQMALVAQPDGDGDGYPLDLDCDDTNPDRHPGALEIPGNGIDDDCNPLTPPWGTPASILEPGTGETPSSDAVGCLMLLVVPLGVLLAWKCLRRRR